MELSTIKSNNLNWGEAASDLNKNFGKINNAIEQVKNATTRNKGYFTTSEALIDAYPTGANVGDYAYVGIDYPFDIWQWDGLKWYDTGINGGENVGLGNYYTRDATDEKFEKLSEELEANKSEANERFSELGLLFGNKISGNV